MHAQGTSRNEISQSGVFRCSKTLQEAPSCIGSLQRFFVVQAIPVVPVVLVVPGSLERIWHKLQSIRHEVVQAHQCLVGTGTGTLEMSTSTPTLMEGLDTNTLCQNFTTNLAAKLHQDISSSSSVSKVCCTFTGKSVPVAKWTD